MKVARVAAAAFAGLFASVSAIAPASAHDVLTQHNDRSRSGAQLTETVLTPANVHAGTFGRLYARNVDGQILAQPLYVDNVNVAGHNRNIVIVATMRNTVYAFDASSTDTDPNHAQVWPARHLGHAAEVPNMCAETHGPVGIVSTPVIDKATNTIYVVARVADGAFGHVGNWYVNALDLRTGQRVHPPVRVDASVAGADGPLPFNPDIELQRASLLLLNGVVYAAFSALNCDNPGWHGWVLGYRASDLHQMGIFCTTPGHNGWGGGIWQSGNGLVSDGTSIFFATGNGSSNATDHGESFVKLRVTPAFALQAAAKYTVPNAAQLNGGDTDLGSGGPMLLPGLFGNGKRIIGGGKDGRLYVLETQTLTPSQPSFQALFNTWHMPPAPDIGPAIDPAHYQDGELQGPNIHTGPIYWHGRIYVMPEKEYIKAFPYDENTGAVNATPIKGALRVPDGMPGAFLSVSANGNANGIVWASFPKQDAQWGSRPGRLVAFNATTLEEIWRDDDDIAFAKFVPPTIADGRVFRATAGSQIVVYGLTAQGGTPCYDITTKWRNFGGPFGLIGSPLIPESIAPDGVGHYRHFQYFPRPDKGGDGGNLVVASIYWTPGTCAQVVYNAIRGKWSALGWELSPLGYPTTDESGTPDGIGRYNHFQHGSIYWTPATGANAVYGAIHALWASLGWERSALGYPIADEEPFGVGRRSRFQHGAIVWDAVTGAHVVP
jgi:hypothetical protein